MEHYTLKKFSLVALFILGMASVSSAKIIHKADVIKGTTYTFKNEGNATMIYDDVTDNRVEFSTKVYSPSLETDTFSATTIQTSSMTILTTNTNDPQINFETTNTANKVRLFLDESAINDLLTLTGQTGSVETGFHIHSQDGNASQIELYSGNTNKSQLIMGAADNFSIINAVQDKNIVLQINDGGVTKTITWDADVDLLKHSAGQFNFDDDGLRTSSYVFVAGIEYLDGTVQVSSPSVPVLSGYGISGVTTFDLDNDVTDYYNIGGDTLEGDTLINTSGSGIGLTTIVTFADEHAELGSHISYVNVSVPLKLLLGV